MKIFAGIFRQCSKNTFCVPVLRSFHVDEIPVHYGTVNKLSMQRAIATD